ncbi:MAG TPA: DinB family protein [Thermoanaerobaculia bacterium]
MKRLFGSAVVLALACVLALPVQAQDKAMEKTAKKEDMREQVKSTGGVRGSILFQIDQAREKLIALANAMPADKFGWRPGEGVRTTGEVFNHVAAANFFLPTFWGAKVPAGVNPQTLEKEMSGDKAKTIEALTKSFDSAREAILAVPDSDLDRKIKLFGQEATVRDAMMVIASHAHEHLGQSIAYARSNGIVPPWSAKGD